MESADQIYRGDDGTALRFYSEPVKNNFQSERLGRPVFDTSLMVEVMTPGSNESVPKFEVERVYNEEAGLDANGERLVERSHKYIQYEKQIEAFRHQTGNYVENGTPISQWANIDAGTAATLKAAGIHSVEMLAGIQDQHLQNLGTGGRVLREQAQAFINARTFGIPTAQMAAETGNLRDENARLQAEIKSLGERLGVALAENAGLRTGTTPVLPPSAPATDPLSPTTISNPDPFATLDSGTASPLAAADMGLANKQAQERAEQGQPPAPGTLTTVPPPPLI